MPDTSKDRGIVGESFKEVWIGDARQRDHDAMMADMGPMPKGMARPAYEPPWTSLGQAPSASQVEQASYGGCA